MSKRLLLLSQPTSRALGLLIAKFKAIGGMPYNVYTNYLIQWCGPLWLTVQPFGEQDPLHV